MAASGDMAVDESAPSRVLSLYGVLVAAQVLLLLFCIYLIQGVVQRWAALPVSTIEVVGGLENIEPMALRRKVLGLTSERFLDLPLQRIREALQADPWADRVELYRRWPRVLEVRVSEHRPVARWGSGGLVNGRGDVFVPETGAEFSSLPLLSGPPNRALEMMSQYRDLTQLLRPLNLKLTALEMEARGAWALTLDNGIRLQLGRGKTLERMNRFLRIYSAQLKDYADRIQQVDVRYTNGLTVTWNEPPTRAGSK